MSRIISENRGKTIGINLSDPDLFPAVSAFLRRIDSNDKNGVTSCAIGPKTVEATGSIEAAAELVRSATKHPLLYWTPGFIPFLNFGEGAPVVTPDLIEPLKKAGFKAAIGFLNADSAAETVAAAHEAGIEIVFSGASVDGYRRASSLGIKDFFVGYDYDHLRYLAQTLPESSMLWSAPARPTFELLTALLNTPVPKIQVIASLQPNKDELLQEAIISSARE